MTYQTLEAHLDSILKTVCLTDTEKTAMKMLYMNPGLSVGQVIQKKHIDRKTLEGLNKMGLLLKYSQNRTQKLYPVPLAILCTKVEQLVTSQEIMSCQDALNNMDKWMKYPAMRVKETQLKSTQEKETIIKWLFELHQTDWDSVYCFGDYESFIKDMGIDPELEWIKERAKKGRSATVFATQDGQWAQRINESQEEELRECCVTPGDFSDLFIMAFPDINTTVIAGKENEITFVHSKSISQHYAEMVKKCVNE